MRAAVLAITTCGCSMLTGLDDFGVTPTESVTSAGGGTGVGGQGATSAGGATTSSTTTASGGNGQGPASCLEIHEANPEAPDGPYLIDPDPADAIPPFTVICDMATAGGGWTRFHWVGADIPQDVDPLGGDLPSCEVSGVACLGRIPPSVEPAQLLVEDYSRNGHAVWTFDAANATSNAVLHALRDKTEACFSEGQLFMPVEVSSADLFCGTGEEGGCDSFMYSNGNCASRPGWTLELDGDNLWAKAAFKVGWMYSSLDPCGAGDYMWQVAYLDYQGCGQEYGAFYYR
jgi:hypothetical protein